MALFENRMSRIEELNWDGETCKKIDGRWAVTNPYLDYWIVGFESEADARIVEEALETVQGNAADAAQQS